jgi:hypothetical protein
VNIIITGRHTIPHDHWCFVKESDFYDNHIDRHRVDRSQNVSIIDRSSLIRNVRVERNEQYMPGPDRDDIQRVTTRSVDQVAIIERNRPGSEKLKNNQLEIFKPSINPDVDSNTRRAPRSVFSLDEINKKPDGKTFQKQGQLKIPSNPRIQERNQPWRKIQNRPPVRETKPDPGKRTSPPKKVIPRKKGN